MFELELKFKVNGREVPCDAFVGALKLQLVDAIKAAIQQCSPEPARQTLPQQGEVPERRAFSLDETAELLSVSKATIARRIREGKLRAIHVGSRVLVPSESIEGVLREGL